jgi:(heptosyl)LPS beta-1,4-glucosyltransferase
LIHAKVVIGGKTGKLKNPLLHYTCTDLGDYIARINARTSLTAQQCGHPVCLLTCLLHAWGRFLKMYFAGAGFLDGKEGLILSVLSSYNVFLRYLKVWEKEHIKRVVMKEEQK